MSGSYRSFIKVLEKWPIDKLKTGKDLGEDLRKLFSHTFPQGSSTGVQDVKQLNRQILALQKLTEDANRTNFPCSSNNTFTDLDIEHLQQITATETMKQLGEEGRVKESLFTRLRNIRILS